MYERKHYGNHVVCIVVAAAAAAKSLQSCPTLCDAKETGNLAFCTELGNFHNTV